MVCVMLKKPSSQQTALKWVVSTVWFGRATCCARSTRWSTFPSSLIGGRALLPGQRAAPLDPTLMFKALLVGYLFGVHSERQLCSRDRGQRRLSVVSGTARRRWPVPALRRRSEHREITLSQAPRPIPAGAGVPDDAVVKTNPADYRRGFQHSKAGHRSSFLFRKGLRFAIGGAT